MEDPNNQRGQTAIDYVVKKSDWNQRPSFWDAMVRDEQYANTWGYTINKNLVNETRWVMDAPEDYVVDADDGSGWSFAADMSALMTNYEDEEDTYLVQRPP